MAYNNPTPYPSVTQILRPYIDTSWFTEESALRGSMVHEAIKMHLLGLWVPSLPDDYRGYFDSFRRWSDEMITEIVLVEERCSDTRLKFTGQLDLIAKIKGDEQSSLVDFKTGAALDKSWPIQIAAYRHLAKFDKKIETFSGMSTRLKKDGSGALCKRYPMDYKPEFNIFLGILNAWRYFNG